jgi:tRNA threonylcarbamoyladenosine biosynthesis protein TsaB
VTTLVIDTCLAACQVGLFEAGRLLAGASEPMERGHQERLAPMAAEVMAGASFDDLRKIVVTIGPGSFTGLRVGLAFAKGLQLATGAPLAGVGTLQALAASAEGATAGVIDARRGLVYVQAFAEGRPLAEPDTLPIAEAARRLAQLEHLTLVGPGAWLLADVLPHARIDARAAPDLATLGRLADAAAPADDLRPLYLRAPDAKPAPPRPASS